MTAVVTELLNHDKKAPSNTALVDGRPHSEPPKAAAKGRRKRSFLALTRSAVIVMGVGLAIVIPLGWGQWVAGFTDQSTDNAYVRADTTPVSAQIAGHIHRILVKDYENVHAGQVLAEIDAAEYQAKVGRAKAAVSAAEAAIRNVGSRVELQHRVIAQAQASVLAAAADRDRAASEYDRQKTAARDGWSTSQRLEEALAGIKRFEAQMAEKQAGIEAERQQLNVLDTQREQAAAELDSRRAELELAEIELGYTEIVAPTDGVVNASSVRTGQYVTVGTRVISVVPLPNVYVVANYKETQLGKVRVGQAVTIAVDMFPGQRLDGRVEQISPASGSEFALLPADNATGNFTKVAQRIAVKIELTDLPDGMRELLRPGMSVVSTIHTDEPAAKRNEH